MVNYALCPRQPLCPAPMHAWALHAPEATSSAARTTKIFAPAMMSCLCRFCSGSSLWLHDMKFTWGQKV